MYHNINAICKKIDLIKEKADELRHQHNTTSLDTGQPDPDIQYKVEDIQALCRDIVNDKGHY